MDQEYHLVGIVNFLPPAMKRRSSDNNDIGHFVGIAKRRNSVWVEYNDLKKSETVHSNNFEVSPQILIYSI